MHGKQLRKIVYALNEHKLNRIIQAHQDRGWVTASEVKDYGYGLGVLMVWGQESPLEMKEKQ
jgi:hypothetical protein